MKLLFIHFWLVEILVTHNYDLIISKSFTDCKFLCISLANEICFTIVSFILGNKQTTLVVIFIIVKEIQGT